jgi:hypothetical protein
MKPVRVERKMFRLCVSGREKPNTAPDYGEKVQIARKHYELVFTFIPTHNPPGKKVVRFSSNERKVYE